MNLIAEFVGDFDLFRKRVHLALEHLYDVHHRWSNVEPKYRKIRHMSEGVEFALREFYLRIGDPGLFLS